jgi:hypothetical protein
LNLCELPLQLDSASEHALAVIKVLYEKVFEKETGERYPPVPFSRISIQLSAGFVLHQETDGITFPAEG